MKKIIITENQLKKLLGKQIDEQKTSKEDGSYMVLSNLMSIKEYVDTILKYKHNPKFSDLVTGEHAWAGDHIATSKDDIQEVANFIENTLSDDDLNENKKMEKNPCWKGYEMVGKKMKNGKEVPNCVPKKKKIEEDEYGSVEETDFVADDTLNEAEYKGRKVNLGKIMQGDVKKFKVYVKNDKGNVVKVNFGDPNMRIKKNNPERRKSFRARHKCDNPGPKWKARYWACKTW